MRIFSCFIVVPMLFSLSACTTMETRQGKGTMVGAGVGAAVGAGLGQLIGKDTESTLIGAGIGATLGGVAGNQWGRNLDRQEDELRRQLANSEAVTIRREHEQLSMIFKSDLMFAFGATALQSGANQEMTRVANVLNSYPDSSIIVRGHTDSIGGEQSNQRLSEGRAEAVKTALVGKGVSAYRIRTSGYGETQPIADNTTEGGRQQNRRVEITIAPPA